jgi:heat shock protein HtpX
MMNTLRTGILMAALTGLFIAVGALLGGGTGVLIAFAMALAMNAFAYWNSDKVLLSMYGARQVDAASEPQLYGLVEKLAAQAQLGAELRALLEAPPAPGGRDACCARRCAGRRSAPRCDCCRCFSSLPRCALRPQRA